MTFSAGMAKDGLQPFCNIYSSFAQRAYDNIIHDAAILNLPVVLCLDRAGLVGEDGATHHGAFDMAFLRPIPNVTIASPMDERELRRLMFTAQLPEKGFFVIRYPRGSGALMDWQCPLEEVKVGTGRKLYDKTFGTDQEKAAKSIAVLTIGPVGNDALKAIEELEQENKCTGRIAHYDMRFLKPIDENILEEVGQNFSEVITVEDGAKNGGLGTAVMEWLNEHNHSIHVQRLALPDEFIEQGTVQQLRQLCGIDKDSIKREIEERL